jgi:membrane protein implicated in regulation of membrane protease activity
MNGTPIKARVIFRYAVLQALGLVVFVTVLAAVRTWVAAFPWWLFWLLIALWIAKDVALYPCVWRSYDSLGGADAGPAVGSSGVARETLAPSGYLEIGGELWKAEVTGGAGVVDKGGKVRVTGRKGLILSVEPQNHAP